MLGEVERIDLKASAAEESLAVAEELEIGPRDRLAADRVGDEVPGLSFQRLLGDRRVGDPEDDLAHVAIRHASGQQIRAGLFQRGGDRDPAVKMRWPRLEIERPGGDLRADVLLLVFRNQAIAQVGDVHLLPVELLRIRFEIRLHVGEQFIDPDGVSVEIDPAAVAEAVFDRGPAPAGWVAIGSKRPQLPTIWSSCCWPLP